MRLTRRTFIGVSALSLTNVVFGQTKSKKKLKKRIVFIAGSSSHGYAEHEHYAGCRLLADRLNALPGVKTEVIKNKWPDDDAILEKADAVVIYCDGEGLSVTNGHEDSLNKLLNSKVSLGFIHYALIPPKSQNQYLMEAIGGFYQLNWSVNPIWQPTSKKFPRHPVTNGVRPFSIRDEWYYHMRFGAKEKNITMLLSDLPPAETLIRPDGPHSNNAHVRKAVLEKKQKQHLAWLYERNNGGRGFGFTGGHYQWNWAQDDYRKLMLNAVAWLARVDIPAEGIASKTPTYEELVKHLGPVPENTDVTAVKKLLEDFKKPQEGR